MNFKGTVFTSILLGMVVLLAWVAWDQHQGKAAILSYASQLEEAYVDSVQTLTLANTELSAIAARQLDKNDELNKALEGLQFKLDEKVTTIVKTDTMFVHGVADTVYVDGEETVYRINEITTNYTIKGTMRTPSGVYTISVTQAPFGLEIREVITPTGQRRVYANIVGRDDLTITDVDYQSSYAKKKEKNWALGVGTIITDEDMTLAGAVRYKTLTFMAGRGVMSAAWTPIRF